MGLETGNNQGGKNSNFNWQLRVLQLLGSISAGVQDDDAIAAVAAEDTVTGLTYAFITVRDPGTGVVTFLYFDGDGNPFTPINPMRIVPTSGVPAYAEDSPHSSGDLGLQILAVREDALSPLTNANNDYSYFKVNVNGELYIIDETARATLAGILVDTGSIDAHSANIEASLANIELDIDTLEGTAYLESSSGLIGSKGTFILARRNDNLTSTFADADGEWCGIATDEFGRVFVDDLDTQALIQTLIDNDANGTQYMQVVDDQFRYPIGSSLTTTLLDGDLATIDTLAEAIATDPTANAGDASVKYSLTFMSRWNLRLMQGLHSYFRAEDSASSTGDTGLGMLAIQRAVPADTAADLDYSFLQMSGGRLWTSTIVEASENHIGAVGGNSGYVELTLSLDTSIYATGDVLFDTQEITAALRLAGVTGIIHSICLVDEDAQAQAIDLIFLRTNVSIGTENSPVTITDANSREILGVVQITTSDYVDMVNSQFAMKSNLGIGVKGDALDDIFVAGVLRSGTPTYTASGITLKVFVLQD